MHLEKLEIQGFKSFANKNTLVFPGILGEDKRGITAVVGPNGSGKSNVADAVRWSLGEQSMKTLRGKKSEDVIFSGSDKKGKLGMAEVSLHFNNEDKKAPIDYSEVVLTRRLYRNGDSEYLLNNSRVRLSDIQMLLAKASFGQKTYSVIGQGMVEGFLNTSLAERKEFFDEATGVKQYQIKRDDALNKLKQSYENLIQAEMLVNEIEPRMKSLTRQVAKLEKREELERESLALKTEYYGQLWREMNEKFKTTNHEYLELDKERMGKEKKVAQANAVMEDFQKNSFKDNGFDRLQTELAGYQSEKNALSRELARIDAQIELKLEAEGKFDLAFMHNKTEELKREAEKLNEEKALHKQEYDAAKNNLKEFEERKRVAEAKLRDFERKLREVSRTLRDEDAPDLRKSLDKVLVDLDRLKSIDDVVELRKLVAAISKELRNAIEHDAKKTPPAEKPNEAWNALYKEMEAAGHEKDEALKELNVKEQEAWRLGEKLKQVENRAHEIAREIEGIEAKVRKYSGLTSDEELEAQKKELLTKVEKLDKEIIQVREKIGLINQEEEKKRQQLFAVQKEVQVLQNELNALNSRLGNLRIEATRYETRLEDLETEIREELGNLSGVKEAEIIPDYNTDLARNKINHLKKQLEHIGGIDPSVVQEYETTKERFDFLSKQTTDLKETIHSLEKVIKELDHVIKEKFDKEFKEIAKKFEEYFKILFNGGSARIEKIMDVHEEEAEGEKAENSAPLSSEMKRIKFLEKHNSTGLAGIEIKANPPGKRIASVAMLSGGERALTSIALICAIISSNPSPFVVLDEVDAALDEANSERLASILDELSHKTQFIVITHNRASMRKANILYGVTMGDDGVSKLLSVKLDEVKAK